MRTYQEVKSIFESEGYTLLSDSYDNVKQRLLVRCRNNHEYETTLKNFLAGARCKTCSIANKTKIELKNIVAYINSEGVEVPTTHSELAFIPKNKLRVVYICSNCGNKFITYYNSMLTRKAYDTNLCRKCSIIHNNVQEKRRETCLTKYGYSNPAQVPKFKEKRRANSSEAIEAQRNNFNSIKQEFIEAGYTLLTDKYVNRMQKLDYICNIGHSGSITYASWSRGYRCKICGHTITADKRKHTYEEVKSMFEKEGYTLLSTEYNRRTEDLTYKCPIGHVGTVKLSNWISNDTRCSSCSHVVSKQELEVMNFLSPLFPDMIHSDREIIKPKELDIVIPSKKVAIEYCGLYWHSESNGKDKNYHLSKLQDCERVGYRLITIFEDEWLYKNDIVKSMLLNKLGVSDKPKIFARKCEVKEIIPSRKNGFLNRNHIQGQDTSAVNLGAFYDGRLVSVMTFSKGSISRNIHAREGVYELSRFCSDHDYNVVGIAGKLLKYFENNYNPVELYTYSDKRWSDGNLYRQLGFDFAHDSIPNYFYIVEGRRVHRFNFRKNVLKDKLKNFNTELTEKENMIANGYEFVYDCGNSKWMKLYS